MTHSKESGGEPVYKWANQQGLYVPKKSYFGAKMAVFGPNILIILWGSKSSGTHISENHLGTSFALFFSVGHGTKRIRKPTLQILSIAPIIKDHQISNFYF